MQKADFKVLARELDHARPDRESGPQAMYTWRKCVDAVAEACGARSTRFDLQKFRHDCGYWR